MSEIQLGPNGKPLDVCWEALVQETAANPAIERSKLNTALKAIRAAAFSEGLVEDEAVAEEIRLRAAAYRQTMGGCCLTPMALANHWFRVVAQLQPISAAPAAGRRQQALDQARLMA